MIPRLNLSEVLLEPYAEFIEALRKTSFTGEIRTDWGSRVVTGTDNSIYQVSPQAIVFPKSHQDVVTLLSLADEPQWREIHFTARGAGTGTNGQSLSAGIIIDGSKYLNQILELNLTASSVRVQCGVVLDQLNQFLKPHGVFFAPNLSPSSRATIGGMVNTDACGKGSRIYGKTSDHVLALRCVMSDGSEGEFKPLSLEELEVIKKRDDLIGQVYRQIDSIVSEKQELIQTQFPKLRRFLTGYNLAKVYSEERTHFDLNAIWAGSEGTLGVVTEALLKLTPLPKYKKLLLFKYSSFDQALSAARNLLEHDPAAIETIDETILKLSQQDSIYPRVEALLVKKNGTLPNAVNLVEFIDSDENCLQQKIIQACQAFDGIKVNDSDENSVEYYVAQNEQESSSLWELRKKGVGLLANTRGPRKPVPFIEDTAVPPESLAAYIQEFRQLLEEHGLKYAMFGHVDVGCLHVRPLLNLQDPEDQVLIRKLSDAVVDLVQKYGGVLWAEHGKGFRSEYTPRFFGRELYQDLRKIKEAFDPTNKMNPGKIATPYSSSLKVAPLESPLRGHQDQHIHASLQQEYEGALSCNGNGACFNVNPHDVMCPSSKITRDRVHSPKGRASVIREWLRQLSLLQPIPQPVAPTNPLQLERMDAVEKPIGPVHRLSLFWKKMKNTQDQRKGLYDYSHEVYDAMAGCLSCKACATQCPVHVDIPEFKSKFLHVYHQRYFRPLRDYLVALLEWVAPLQARIPRLSNFLMQISIFRFVMSRLVGLLDLPSQSETTLRAGLQQRKPRIAKIQSLQRLSPTEKTRSVLLVLDGFTSFYESEVVLSAYDFLGSLGYTVYMVPLRPNGKPLHVKGFLNLFETIARRNASYFQKLAQFQIPMVGIDPSIVLTYRQEYLQTLGAETVSFQIHLLQEWLTSTLNDWKTRLSPQTPDSTIHYYLLGHCTEKTAAPASQNQWKQIFDALGLSLNLIPSGCCGMAGIYGHESEHYIESKGIYHMSWESQIIDFQKKHPVSQLLATGYSCRSQVKRFDSTKALHPIQVLQSRQEKHRFP